MLTWLAQYAPEDNKHMHNVGSPVLTWINDVFV
jgi:hypothetical protein